MDFTPTRTSLNIVFRWRLIIFGFIVPIVEYGDPLFDSYTKTLRDMLEEIKLENACTATGAKWWFSHDARHHELVGISLYDRQYIYYWKYSQPINTKLFEWLPIIIIIV